MCTWPFVAIALVLSFPVISHGQSLEVHGSAGPALADRGYSVAAGAGWSPGSRLTLSLNIERTTHLSSVVTDGRGGSSAFRGGTFTLGTAELMVTLLARDRMTPYLLAGVAAGVSRPTVNGTFPQPITNNVRGVVGGAGFQVPLRPGLGVFTDVRMILGEGAGELLPLATLRIGMRGRF